MSSNIFEPGPAENMVRGADGELRRVPERLEPASTRRCWSDSSRQGSGRSLGRAREEG